MKVLIIDRVKVFQHIIADILSDSKIDYLFASTGEEALESINRDSFQCICVSMHLDDIDGLDLCKHIRRIKAYKHTPIVLLTTNNDPEQFKRAMFSGITDVFSKDKIHELVNFIARFTQVDQSLIAMENEVRAISRR